MLKPFSLNHIKRIDEEASVVWIALRSGPPVISWIFDNYGKLTTNSLVPSSPQAIPLQKVKQLQSAHYHLSFFYNSLNIKDNCLAKLAHARDRSLGTKRASQPGTKRDRSLGTKTVHAVYPRFDKLIGGKIRICQKLHSCLKIAKFIFLGT